MANKEDARRIERQELAPHPKVGGMSKREKFGWQPLDERGIYAELPKDLLHVDHTYQRDKINNERVSEYAADFKWLKCGTIQVALRPDGRYFVVDGQHRALAAAKRDDIKTIPCMVFFAKDVAAEAGAFIAINTDRGQVSTPARHKAGIASHDPAALALESALEQAGLRIQPGGNGGTIQAVGMLYKMLHEDAKLMVPVLSLVREVAGSDGVNSVVLGALFWIARQDPSVLWGAHASRLVELGQAALLSEVHRHRVIVGKGGPMMDARPIVALLNKGRRSHKLNVEGA